MCTLECLRIQSSKDREQRRIVESLVFSRVINRGGECIFFYRGQKQTKNKEEKACTDGVQIKQGENVFKN